LSILRDQKSDSRRSEDVRGQAGLRNAALLHSR
jgi:hypothetical protein